MNCQCNDRLKWQFKKFSSTLNVRLTYYGHVLQSHRLHASEKGAETGLT